MTGFEPATSGLTGRRERPSFTTPPNGDRLSLRRESIGGVVLEAGGQVSDQSRATGCHRFAVTKENLLVDQSGKFLHRSQRLLVIGTELRIGGGDPSLGAYQCISSHQYPGQRIEQADVTGGVPWSTNYVEAEDVVAVNHGSQLTGSSDPVEITLAGITGGAAGGFQDGRGTALVIGMTVGEDDMADLVPTQTDFSQGSFDFALAPRYSRVDDGGLGSPHDDVGRDKAEVDPLELSLRGRRGSQRG